MTPDNFGPNEASFSQAKIANEVIKAEKSKHQLQQLKDTVIDRQRAISRVTELATTARDDWRSWPARRISHIAKRLEVSNDLVESLLQPSIDHHLKELDEINVRLN